MINSEPFLFLLFNVKLECVAARLRGMRLFYEERNELAICQTLSGKLKQAASDRMPASLSNDSHLPPSGKLDSPASKDDIEFCQPEASKLEPDDSNAFMSVGFTHHMAIIRACKSLDERLFYIRNVSSGKLCFECFGTGTDTRH